MIAVLRFYLHISFTCFVVSDDPLFCQNLAEGAETRHPMIYFKVIRIEPEPWDGQTYIADDRHTTLIQVNSELSIGILLVFVYLFTFTNAELVDHLT